MVIVRNLTSKGWRTWQCVAGGVVQQPEPGSTTIRHFFGAVSAQNEPHREAGSATQRRAGSDIEFGYRGGARSGNFESPRGYGGATRGFGFDPWHAVAAVGATAVPWVVLAVRSFFFFFGYLICLKVVNTVHNSFPACSCSPPHLRFLLRLNSKPQRYWHGDI